MIKIGDKVDTKFKVGDEAWIVLDKDPFSDPRPVKIKIEKIEIIVGKNNIIQNFIYYYYPKHRALEPAYNNYTFKTKAECIDYYMACVKSMLTRGSDGE